MRNRPQHTLPYKRILIAQDYDPRQKHLPLRRLPQSVRWLGHRMASDGVFRARPMPEMWQQTHLTVAGFQTGIRGHLEDDGRKQLSHPLL